MDKSILFSSLRLRDLELKNRIAVSPMCQYSAEGGVPNAWHLVHLGSRAVGGAGLVICEATAVAPEGRISSGDTGMWNQEQVQAFRRITDFILEQDSIPGIQLAHAGRKASAPVPWSAQSASEELSQNWTPIAPSAIAFSSRYAQPKALSPAEIESVEKQFVVAAERALEAGFRVVELHMAHGYLLHEFLSPLSNIREDDFGGSLENRMRFPLSVAEKVRRLWPKGWPVFVRVSATDWVEGGWSLEECITFSLALKDRGIDLIDCSSGGNVPHAKIPVGPAYQVPLSQKIRQHARIATGAVGMISEAKQAEIILREEQADLILLGREFLRDPYWPLRAARALGVDLPWPKQYSPAKP